MVNAFLGDVIIEKAFQKEGNFGGERLYMSDHSLLSAVWKMNVFRSDKEEVSTVARVGLGQSDVTVEFLNLHCRSDNPLFRLFDKIYQVSDFRTERNNIFDSSQGIFQTGTALINLPVTFSYIIDHIFGEMAFFSQDQSIDSIVTDRIVGRHDIRRNIFVGAAAVTQ